MTVEFGLGHREAGSLFFFIASGQCLGLLASGFVASRVNHRLAVFLSVTAVGATMLVVSKSNTVTGLCTGLFLLGVSEGLYFPSGVAILTGLTSKPQWGKAMAIHELAPNLALVTAPLLAEALFLIVPWRGITGIVGVWAILTGLLFLFRGHGGTQKGTPPNVKAIWTIVRKPSFWIIAAVLAFAVGASDGLYAMLPLFLVRAIGLEREFANMIIGLSHVSGLVVIFFSGLITDRIGPKRAMTLISAITGIFTLMLGILRGTLVISTLVFLQATAIACLFPPVLVIASLNFPSHVRNLALSLLLIVSIFVGAGVIPPTVGYLAEAVSFSLGIGFIGILLLASLPLLFLLRASPNGRE
jgi:NNP family nitrate/nitrite transporter-like MFS transporter